MPSVSVNHPMRASVVRSNVSLFIARKISLAVICSVLLLSTPSRANELSASMKSIGTVEGASVRASSVRATLDPVMPSVRTISDDVVGVSLDVPAAWRVQQDPVLFNTYGFALFDPESPKTGGHERSPLARIALAYEAKPDQIEALVRRLMREYREFPLTRFEVAVGENLTGVAVGGLPGTDPYTLVYVADGERVYRIGLWTPEAKLDTAARTLLRRLRFDEPKRTIASLDLIPVERAMRQPLAPELARRNEASRLERVALVANEMRDEALMGEESTPVVRRASLQSCEVAQPTSLLWQTYWDGNNRFYSGYTTTYSGTYYNLRPSPSTLR